MTTYARIPGFPNYRVSDQGNVESKYQRGSRRLSDSWGPLKSRPGGRKGKEYLGVVLCNGPHIRKSVRIHRLVAELFVARPPSAECVRHLDGDRFNNAASNLSWGTYKDNEQDKKRHGTWYDRCSGKLSRDQVLGIRELVRVGATHQTVAKKYGVSRPTITRTVNRKIWKHIL